MSTPQKDQERIRLYLLGELAGAEEEAFELRLLTDAEFAEEFEVVEEELVDQYAAGDLAQPERARLERRFFNSPERRRKLRVALALREHAPGRQSREKKLNVTPLNAGRRRARFVPPPVYLKAAAAVLFAVGLGVAVWWVRAGDSEVERGMVALNEAFKSRRTVEPRVTAVGYAPLVVTRGRDGGNVDSVARSRAERLLLDAVDSSPGARSRHALGRFYLVDAQFDKAVEQLEHALRDSPNDAQAHSDLGAALLELGREQEQAGEQGKALEDYGRALEHFDRAAELDATLLEPLFNKALVLEYQGVPEQAKEAWRLYLARDPQSSWAAEAKRRLDLLSERVAVPTTPARLIEDFLTAARARDDERAWHLLSRNKDMIAGRFIPQQLAANYLEGSDAGGADESARLLDALSYAGRLEHERARDPYVSEVAAFYARASARQRALLREAQGGVRLGYRLCRQSNFKDALAEFVRSKELFEKAGDEWEGRLCDYWIGYCYSQVDRLGESTALLKSLADYSRRGEYKWLFGQATCWIGANYAELADHSNSIRYYEAALPVVEEIGDSYNSQKILSQLASQYNHLGQPRRALEYNWRSLHAAGGECSSLRQLWRNNLYAARTFINLKLYHAALAYGGEMLRVALDDIKEADIIHYSYIYLGQIYGGMGRYDEAIRVTNESIAMAHTLSSDATRKQGAYSVLQIAHLQRQAGRCADALASYDEAIRTYERMELRIYSYEAHKGRLMCHVALGHDAEVEAELPVVLAKFEEYRRLSLTSAEQHLIALADREQGVYDIAIDHAYEKGEAERAFDYSEKSRSRSLLDTLRKRAPSDAATAAAAASPEPAEHASPASLSEIKDRMPAGVQAVQYTVLADKTLIWLVTRGQARVIESAVGAAELDAKVSAYLELLTRGPADGRDELARMAAELYDKLVAPVAPLLDPQKVVCVIPDKAVSRLSFAALKSSATGRYLISDFTLMSSPSLNVFLHCSDEARNKTGAETLLSVGNPAFDRQDYPALPNLPASAREARGIARLYSPDAREFVGPEAVRENIVRELPRAAVIHFAGHYLPHARDPMSSRLVLAGGRGASGGDDGSLSARDLVGRKLPRAKLVILSGCHTGGESYYNGEGLIGISRTFLGTGIPLVVASQWAVDSEATAELMLKFHRYRRGEARRLPTVAALRRAQLDMLGEPGGLYADPYYWAAFLPVGGDADF
ncbi:MAG: CHAT domain-containing protein [Pyrinomonadaceae bacterium]